MEEIWVDVKDFEGFYQVSNCGRIKSLNYRKTGEERLLHPIKSSTGHLYVNLSKKGKRKKGYIHILVAQAFIPNSENKSDVHHIDHNPTYNHVDNLMWVTKTEHIDLHKENYIMMQKASVKAHSIPILQYAINGQLLKEYPSIREAARQTKIDRDVITRICNGKMKNRDAYIWRYKNMFS